MREVEEFVKANNIRQAQNGKSFYFELNGKNYRVSNHTVEASNAGAFNAEGQQVRELYHPNGRGEEVQIFASPTRIIEIYNAIKDSKQVDGRGRVIGEKYNQETGKYSKEVQAQMEAVRKKYYGTDQWMKAPNGQPTNLTEEQWLLVRTPNFKKWFGDWEKVARIEKLKKSKAVEYKFNNEFELNVQSGKKYLLDNIRNEYENKDTNDIIIVSRQGIDEITSHDRFSEEHLKSFVAIPEMLKRAIFITDVKNLKGNNKFDTYKYFVCGLKIDGVDYTTKIVVGVKDGKQFYDHKLTKIEKNALIDTLDNQSSSTNQNVLSFNIKDSRLLNILQNNFSGVLDENGEPLVVYHGTDKEFSVFDKRKTKTPQFWFTDRKDLIEKGEVGANGKGIVMPVFLNIKKPAGWEEEDRFGLDQMKARGFDGKFLPDGD